MGRQIIRRRSHSPLKAFPKLTTFFFSLTYDHCTTSLFKRKAVHAYAGAGALLCKRPELQTNWNSLHWDPELATILNRVSQQYIHWCQSFWTPPILLVPAWCNRFLTATATLIIIFPSFPYERQGSEEVRCTKRRMQEAVAAERTNGYVFLTHVYIHRGGRSEHQSERSDKPHDKRQRTAKSIYTNRLVYTLVWAPTGAANRSEREGRRK